MLLSERGLGGSDADLELRLRRWRGERGRRAEAARGLAKRWLDSPDPLPTGERESRSSGEGRGESEAPEAARLPLSPALSPEGRGDVGACVALAFPDRVSKRRDSSGADWISVGGRGFRLDPASPLARETWLAVAEVGGTAAGARILAAAPIDQAMVESLFADAHRERAPRSPSIRRPAASAPRHGRRLGAIRLSGGQDSRADPEAVAAALLEGVRAARPAACCRGAKRRASLRGRAAFARRFDPGLARSLRRARWLADARRLAAAAARRQAAPRSTSTRRPCPGRSTRCSAGTGRKAVDRLAPSHFETPAGSRHPIDYRGRRPGRRWRSESRPCSA